MHISATSPEALEGPLPFQGELMRCVLCDRSERSDPAVETQWRALDIDDRIFYACPDEFPPDETGTKEEFGMAYQLCFAAAMLNSLPDPPQHLLDQLIAARAIQPWRQS
jgi:hypothetical protein